MKQLSILDQLDERDRKIQFLQYRKHRLGLFIEANDLETKQLNHVLDLIGDVQKELDKLLRGI